MHQQVLVLGMKDYYAFQNVKIHADESTLTIRPAQGDLRRLPVEQVSGLHLLAGYSITDGLVQLSSQYRFPIHFYSHGGHYQGSINPRPAAPQAAILIAQLNSMKSPDRRMEIGSSIATEQRRLLEDLLSAAGVEPCLPTIIGGTVQDVMLSEARMRKEFYAHLDCALEAFWSILARNRRPPRTPADAVLGFANGIVYAKMAGWIYRTGLDPRLGYLHGETRAPNPLALDLAELVKPHLSEATLVAISRSGKERSLVTEVGEGIYLNESGRKEVIRRIEAKLQSPLPSGASETAQTFEVAFRQIPMRLHRAITTNGPIRWPPIPCTSS